ncbi:putative cysteine peptidase [Metamycoplasma equirhinis]|uniref:putative cysteine peptidase n=3 Tax=Metamycoplasma equirhinis TaxID=92402 RepID=UPI0035939F83
MFNFDYEIAKNINENLIKYDSDFKQNFNKYIKNINLSDYFKFLELEIFKYNKNVNYKLNEIKIIHDKFNNPYIYANFNPFGYIIVSLVNNESIIIEPLRINNNFFDFKTKFNWFNLFSYGKPNNVNINTKDNFLFNEYSKKYFDLNKNLNDINLINEKKNITKKYKKNLNNIFAVPLSNSPAIDHNVLYEIIYAEKEVPYSWWFKCSNWDEDFGYTDVQNLINLSEEWMNQSKEDNNTNEYNEYKKIHDTVMKTNSNQGLCHYVALAMLLEYNEFFRSSNVFSEAQIKKYFKYYRSHTFPNHFEQYEKPIPPEVSPKLVADLWVKHGWGAIITTSKYLKSVAYDFMFDKYALSVHHRLAGSIRPWKWIRDGYPCMIYGSFIPDPSDKYNKKTGHAVVAYGMYDNGRKLLCHYGWSGYSQVIVSSSLSGQLFLIGMKPGKKAKSPIPHFKINRNDINLIRGDTWCEKK